MINLQDMSVTNIGTQDNFDFSSISNNDGFVFVLWDVASGSDPTQNGAIVFFGNYLNNGTTNPNQPNL